MFLSPDLCSSQHLLWHGQYRPADCGGHWPLPHHLQTRHRYLLALHANLYYCIIMGDREDLVLSSQRLYGSHCFSCKICPASDWVPSLVVRYRGSYMCSLAGYECDLVVGLYNTQPTVVLIKQIVSCSFNGTHTNLFSSLRPVPLRVCPPPYSLFAVQCLRTMGECYAGCLQGSNSWVTLILVMSSVFHVQCDSRGSWKMYEQVASSLHSSCSLSILD